MSEDTGEIIVCNAVFRLSISFSVPEIFMIEVRSRPKSRQKACFLAPNFFWGEDPKFWTFGFLIGLSLKFFDCGLLLFTELSMTLKEYIVTFWFCRTC